MTTIIFREWRRPPPSHVRINRGHPLAQGLVFDFDPCGLRDRFSGIVNNAGVVRSGTTHGYAAKFTRSASTYLDFGDLDAWDVGSRDFGFEFVLRLDSPAALTTRMQLLSKDANGARQLWLEINTDDSSGVTVDDNTLAVVWLNGSTLHRRYMKTPFVVGKTHHIIYQRVGSADEAWLDGIPTETVATIGGNNWPAVVSTSASLRMGARVYAGYEEYFDGAISVARFRQKALTHAQAVELANNPYCIYEPERIIIPSAVTTPAAPTISDLRAVNVTSSSTQWSIDYSFS